LWSAVAAAAVYLFTIALNPWSLHIGGRSTPLLNWHGAGTVTGKNGKSYQLYISFWPGRPQGFHGGSRRNGKTASAQLDGNGWICTDPGQIRRLDLSGTLYGGYINSDNSIFEFRLIDYTQPFHMRRSNRGFFDLAGGFRGGELILDRPYEQGVPFDNLLFLDNATGTFHWSGFEEFEVSCSSTVDPISAR